MKSGLNIGIAAGTQLTYRAPLFIESGLYYSPSTIGMAEAGAKLSTVRNAANVLTRAFRRPIDDHTGEGLTEWGSSFDYILMDSPVAPLVVTDNILIAATALLIPVSLEGFTLDGLDNYLGYVADIQQNDNDRLDVLGAVVTMRQANLTEAKQSEAVLREKFGEQMQVSLPPRQHIRLRSSLSRVRGIHQARQRNPKETQQCSSITLQHYYSTMLQHCNILKQ